VTRPDLNAIDTAAASSMSLMELLAEAWLNLSDFQLDPSGRSVLVKPPDGYMDDNWSKNAARMIRQFALRSPRPSTWPWQDDRFDRFWP
jgi:hypothetical protein